MTELSSDAEMREEEEEENEREVMSLVWPVRVLTR